MTLVLEESELIISCLCYINRILHVCYPASQFLKPQWSVADILKGFSYFIFIKSYISFIRCSAAAGSSPHLAHDWWNTWLLRVPRTGSCFCNWTVYRSHRSVCFHAVMLCAVDSQIAKESSTCPSVNWHVEQENYSCAVLCIFNQMSKMAFKKKCLYGAYIEVALVQCSSQYTSLKPPLHRCNCNSLEPVWLPLYSWLL